MEAVFINLSHYWRVIEVLGLAHSLPDDYHHRANVQVVRGGVSMVGEPQAPYEDKFKGLIEAIESAKADEDVDRIVVALPEALGDNYAELVESLNRIAAAGLALSVVPPEERGKTPYDFSRN